MGGTKSSRMGQRQITDRVFESRMYPDSDTLQDTFQGEMDADGYFNALVEPADD